MSEPPDVRLEESTLQSGPSVSTHTLWMEGRTAFVIPQQSGDGAHLPEGS